jgi:hypothetical protein
MKKFFRVLLRGFAGIISLILLLAIFAALHKIPEEQFQENSAANVMRFYPENPNVYDTARLRQEFGQNKILPEEFEFAALLALSFYPELKETSIEFVVRPASIPMASRPTPLSVLKGKGKRHYQVILSSDSTSALADIHMDRISFNAQVGILAHEIAHTVYYEKLSSLSMLDVAISYVQPTFRRNFERATDLRSIYHGAAWPLLEFAEHVRKIEGEGGYMDKYYMSPDEIKKQINQLQIYRNWRGVT